MCQTKYRKKTSKYTWDSDSDPIERYIVIGNGFDLECNLPTSYSQYLSFIEFHEVLFQWFQGIFERDTVASNYHNMYGEYVYPDYKETSLQSVLDKYKSSINQLVFDALNPLSNIDTCYQDHISSESYNYTQATNRLSYKWQNNFVNFQVSGSNFWYQHFHPICTGRGWIDFENEIARLIRLIEDSMVAEPGHRRYLDNEVVTEYPSDLSKLMESPLGYTTLSENIDARGTNLRYRRYRYTYRELRKRLLDDLNDLTRGLETYLRDYVGAIDPTMTPAIEDIVHTVKTCNKSFVISFNYTKTLQDILAKQGTDAEFCYVHGQLGDGKDKNRMVLGIDEYLNSDEVRTRTDFASFRKYNQRIFKETDSSYRNWIAAIESQKDIPRELVIFGHSLGITDQDILRSLITAPNMRTVIYYHDEDAFSEKLANITAILGMDYVIERTGGEMHTLKFEQQKQPKP